MRRGVRHIHLQLEGICILQHREFTRQGTPLKRDGHDFSVRSVGAHELHGFVKGFAVAVDITESWKGAGCEFELDGVETPFSRTRKISQMKRQTDEDRRQGTWGLAYGSH